MVNEPDYIVKVKDEYFDMKTEIKNAEKNVNKNNKKGLIICIMGGLICLLPIFFFFLEHGFTINPLVIILFIALLLGILIGVWVIRKLLKNNTENYIWEIEAKNRKIYIKIDNYEYEINFENLISVKTERNSVAHYSDDEIVYDGYRSEIVIKHITEKNNINIVKLPYKMEYDSLLMSDENYIQEENEIEKFINMFITKKQYEENPNIYNSNEYLEIRNSEEEEKFKENLIKITKKNQIFNKKDIYMLSLMLILIIVVIVWIILGQGGK